MKKTNLLIFVILLFFTGSVIAQPAIEWQKSIGGSGSDFGKGLCMAKDSLSYYISGYTSSTNGNILVNNGGFDLFLSKVGLNGNVYWTKTYGGLDNDYLQSMIPTHDNGVLLCGFTIDTVTPGTHGEFDIMLIKVDSAGNQQWKHFYGGSLNEGDLSIGAIQTADNGFVCVSGSSSSNGDVSANYGSSDFWLFKTDSSGNLIWSKNFGGTDDEDAHAVLPMPDGGFIMAGHTASNDSNVSGHHNPNSGLHDGWVVRIDSARNIVWQNCIGGTDFELINHMIFDNSGNIVIAGYTASNDGNNLGNHGLNDFWVAKLDTANGSLISSHLYGGPDDDYGTSLMPNADGTLTLSGYSNSISGDVSGNHGTFDYWILKVDVQGNIIWENSYGGSDNDRSPLICPAVGDGIIFNGFSNSINGDVIGNQGSLDSWVGKLSCKKPVADFTASTDPSCAGDSIHFTNISTGALSFQWFINGTFFSGTTQTDAVFSAPGQDTIMLVSTFETCTDTAQHIITIDTTPWVNLGNDTTICVGCNVILDATNPGANFLWSTGEQTQNITVTTTDTIWVAVTLNSCVASDTIIVIVDPFLSLGTDVNSRFSIYPNPASDNISIDCGMRQVFKVSIYDIFGEIILNKELNDTKESLDISSLAPGMYVIKVISNNRTLQKKIIKE